MPQKRQSSVAEQLDVVLLRIASKDKYDYKSIAQEKLFFIV